MLNKLFGKIKAKDRHGDKGKVCTLSTLASDCKRKIVDRKGIGKSGVHEAESMLPLWARETQWMPLAKELAKYSVPIGKTSGDEITDNFVHFNLEGCGFSKAEKKVVSLLCWKFLHALCTETQRREKAESDLNDIQDQLIVATERLRAISSRSDKQCAALAVNALKTKENGRRSVKPRLQGIVTSHKWDCEVSTSRASEESPLNVGKIVSGLDTECAAEAILSDHAVSESAHEVECIASSESARIWKNVETILARRSKEETDKESVISCESISAKCVSLHVMRNQRPPSLKPHVQIQRWPSLKPEPCVEKNPRRPILRCYACHKYGHIRRFCVAIANNKQSARYPKTAPRQNTVYSARWGKPRAHVGFTHQCFVSYQSQITTMNQSPVS